MHRVNSAALDNVSVKQVLHVYDVHPALFQQLYCANLQRRIWQEHELEQYLVIETRCVLVWIITHWNSTSEQSLAKSQKVRKTTVNVVGSGAYCLDSNRTFPSNIYYVCESNLH